MKLAKVSACCRVTFSKLSRHELSRHGMNAELVAFCQGV